MKHRIALLAIALSICLLGAILANCWRHGRSGVESYLEPPFPKNLSEWRLFQGDLGDLQPTAGVVPYELNSPLFTDYASKFRTVWVPPGTSAQYDEKESFNFPEGSILSKTFFYPPIGEGKRRIIETRLLVKAKAGWVGLPYIWNEDQKDAALAIAGGAKTLDYVHPSGKKYSLHYIIPDMNQCKDCHSNYKKVTPIGPKARNLNRDGQIEYWAHLGILKGAPPDAKAQPRLAAYSDPTSGTTEKRARAYLEIHCAHCHSNSGKASNTGLFLWADSGEATELGICKTPVAAGKASHGIFYDVVPGKPADSILVHRIKSNEPGVMMPELGRTIVHEEGVALIEKWILGLKGDTPACK